MTSIQVEIWKDEDLYDNEPCTVLGSSPPRLTIAVMDGGSPANVKAVKQRIFHRMTFVNLEIYNLRLDGARVVLVIGGDFGIIDDLREELRETYPHIRWTFPPLEVTRSEHANVAEALEVYSSIEADLPYTAMVAGVLN